MVDPRRPAGSVEDDWMTKGKNTTDRVHGLFYLKKKEFLKPLDKGCKLNTWRRARPKQIHTSGGGPLHKS